MSQAPAQFTAFEGEQRLVSGSLADVALAVKKTSDADLTATIVIFNDSTGRTLDLDLRGTSSEILKRLPPTAVSSDPPPVDSSASEPRPRGRPKLGVVAREVTLLPRHWDWLGAQPGGASVALRKLVEGARTVHRSADQIRQAQEATGLFMHAMAGDAAGYEEATRALYARDGDRFAALIADWPQDVRAYILALSAAAFAAEA